MFLEKNLLVLHYAVTRFKMRIHYRKILFRVPMYESLHNSVHFLVLLVSDMLTLISRIIYALEYEFGLVLREYFISIHKLRSNCKIFFRFRKVVRVMPIR